MTRPICESMTSRESADQPGWSQWGVLSADGQSFTALYAVESGLPNPSAYYYLAAAGICDIQGQPRAGAPMPDEQPQVNPVAPQEQQSPVDAAPSEVAPSDVAISSESLGTQPWVIGIGVVLLVIIGGAAFTRARRKQTDSTPPPKTFTFNEGADDGNG